MDTTVAGPDRFGIFLAPFHPVGQNPTLALQRDLELIVHLDRQRQRVCERRRGALTVIGLLGEVGQTGKGDAHRPSVPQVGEQPQSLLEVVAGAIGSSGQPGHLAGLVRFPPLAKGLGDGDLEPGPAVFGGLGG